VTLWKMTSSPKENRESLSKSRSVSLDTGKPYGGEAREIRGKHRGNALAPSVR